MYGGWIDGARMNGLRIDKGWVKDGFRVRKEILTKDTEDQEAMVGG